MIGFIARRLALGILVFLGVALITFTLTHVVPADPAAQWAGPRATEEQLQRAEQELNLDKPLYEQFALYLQALLQGDLGRSLRTKLPVATELKLYLPPTMELVAVAMSIALVLGLPMGIVSAKCKDRWPDHYSRFISVFCVSLPVFWTALFLQLIFYSWLGWLPSGGQLDTSIRVLQDIPHVTGFLMIDCLITGNFYLLWNAFLHTLMPAIALATYPIGMTARMTRSSMVEILGEDYIVAPRSYGVPERTVLWECALKNSAGPTITVFTLSIGFTLVNTFIAEAIFNWPGIGTYMAESVSSLDFPAIMGVTLFAAVAYVLLNLIADLLIVYMDPRVRV